MPDHVCTDDVSGYEHAAKETRCNTPGQGHSGKEWHARAGLSCVNISLKSAERQKLGLMDTKANHVGSVSAEISGRMDVKCYRTEEVDFEQLQDIVAHK